MLAIRIPKIIRKDSITASPVSSLIELYHERPKEFYEKVNKNKCKPQN
jgi:hypothetical protein